MNKNENSTPKVSVIIPVWNPGEGISRCMASLRNQTLADIEMIFVDDCGTDSAMDVVRNAAAEDPRICIITNAENVGPGPSRNAGIEVARGEYLSFVDADDYVNAAFLERLYSKAVADNLDIVKGKLIYELIDGTIANDKKLNNTIRKGIESDTPLYCLFTYEHQSAIYSKHFVMKHNLRYGASRRDQDTTFLLKVCHKAAHFDFEEKAEYHYCERNGSLMHDRHPHTFERRLHSLQEKMDYVVVNMAKEESIIQYVADKVYYELMLYAYYKKMPECRNEVDSFLNGVRKEVLRFPQLEKLKEESYTMRVLCEYGVGLAIQPFKLPWEDHRAVHYVETICEWVDFVVDHPYMLADTEKDLYRLFREAEKLCQNSGDGAEEPRNVRRDLSSQAERLPRRCRERIYLQNPTLPHSFVYDIKIGMKKYIGDFELN